MSCQASSDSSLGARDLCPDQLVRGGACDDLERSAAAEAGMGSRSQRGSLPLRHSWTRMCRYERDTNRSAYVEGRPDRESLLPNSDRRLETVVRGNFHRNSLREASGRSHIAGRRNCRYVTSRRIRYSECQCAKRTESQSCAKPEPVTSSGAYPSGGPRFGCKPVYLDGITTRAHPEPHRRRR